MTDMSAESAGGAPRVAAPRDWKTIVDGLAAAVMLATAFVALVASRTNADYAELLWHVAPLVFGVSAVALTWVHGAGSASHTRALVCEALTWVGVYAAIRLVLYFVATDHYTLVNAGLAGAVVLGLGAFLSGVHGQWRMAPIGLALLGATAVWALIEENIWFLIGIGLVALGLVVLAGRLQAQFGAR